jgi:3-mercaptopyruvate sulfurtransferase SseA
MGMMPDLLPDRTTEVVAYRSNFNSHSSTRVVRELTAMGYDDAFECEGGKQDWLEAGYPTESDRTETRAHDHADGRVSG